MDAHLRLIDHRCGGGCIPLVDQHRNTLGQFIVPPLHPTEQVALVAFAIITFAALGVAVAWVLR